MVERVTEAKAADTIEIMDGDDDDDDGSAYAPVANAPRSALATALGEMVRVKAEKNMTS